jgi:uncharacterized membrane protein
MKGQLGQCNATSFQSHSDIVQSQSNHSNNMTLTFIFIMMEGKLALNSRKKYESQVLVLISLVYLCVNCQLILKLDFICF